MLQPKPSIPSQSWRPKTISDWWLWKPRQTGAIQSKKLRLPVPMPLVKPEPRKTSQAVMLHKEHGKFMQGLEEQGFREESRSHHDFLSSCQATLYHSPLLLRGALATFVSSPTGASTPVASTHSATKDSPCRRTSIHSCSFHTNTQTVSKTEKATSFARADGEHAYG